MLTLRIVKLKLLKILVFLIPFQYLLLKLNFLWFVLNRAIPGLFTICGNSLVPSSYYFATFSILPIKYFLGKLEISLLRDRDFPISHRSRMREFYLHALEDSSGSS